MEKELSESIQTDIKEVINTILREIELRNIQPVSGIFPFWISSNNFNYLKDPYDLGRIIDKINKGEKKRVLRVVPNEDYDNHSYSVDGGTNQITEQSIIELQKMKNISDHKYVSFGIDNRLSFLIEDIKKLKDIKNKLSQKTEPAEKSNINKKTEVHISYNINIGKFIFNNKGSVELEGKQKDTAECLVNAGKDVKISWDEIHDKFKDLVDDQDIPNTVELDTRKRSVRTAVKEINTHTKEYLEPNKDLIDAKNNEYWLQYEVDKR